MLWKGRLLGVAMRMNRHREMKHSIGNEGPVGVDGDGDGETPSVDLSFVTVEAREEERRMKEF